jgi:hypothetical protein
LGGKPAGHDHSVSRLLRRDPGGGLPDDVRNIDATIVKAADQILDRAIK